MKRHEVPQDDIASYGGHRKALYAIDASGDYARVPSSGWLVEKSVNADAIEAYRQRANAALERVRAGLSAPLEYHMYDRRMDLALLAEAAGVWRWRLRRHLRPRTFERLGPRWRSRYADALGLAPEQLDTVPSNDTGRA